MKSLLRLHPLLLLLAPVLFLLPSLGGFIYSAGSEITDMTVTHYPYALSIQRAMIEAGQVPLWSDHILSGVPLTANPLSGLHYPPGWLALLFPLPFGLNLAAVVHILFGGYGMYRFLGKLGVDRPARLFGALAFEGMPKWISHLGAGHLTLIYACSWLPWLFMAQSKVEENPRRYWMLPGLILGIIFLADPRFAAVAGIFWVVYALFYAPTRASIRRVAFRFTRLLAGGVFAAGVGAVLLLPLIEFLGRSTRLTMSTTDVATMSLPVSRLLGFVVPEMGGTAEWVVYCGVMVLALVMLALAVPEVQKPAMAWCGFAVIFILLSLGSNLPGYNWLASLPGFNLLRVPPRMMLAAMFALCVAASLGFQVIASHGTRGILSLKFNPMLLLLAFGVFDLVLGAFIWSTTKTFPVRFVWGGVGLLAASIMIILWDKQRISTGIAALLALGILLVDQAGVNALSLRGVSRAAALAQGGEVASSLVMTSAFDDFRVYSPSYSLPQHTAAYYRLELVDGVDPLQCNAYRGFMEQATGIPNPGYSVTLPPFADGEFENANQGYVPDARLLGLLNVRYVVSQFPLRADGLEFLSKIGESYRYHNLFERPRAWLQDSREMGESLDETRVLVLRRPNTINLMASGPGVLVLSELYYPGWSVIVNGRPAEIVQVEGILRGVELGPGNHEVLFRFQPFSFYAGMVISFLFATIAFVYLRVERRPSNA